MPETLQQAVLIAVYTALIFVSVFFFVVAMTTIWWQTHAWRTPKSYLYTGYPTADDPRLTFSIIMPCREETEPVMRATIDRLLAQTHPNVQIIISLSEDDTTTIATAHRIADDHPAVEVSITPTSDPGTGKPRQLQRALTMCTGDIVGIFDAESLAAPDLLRHIDTVFRHEQADVVQGSVQLINHRDTWVSLRSCMEYYFYFRSRLHAQALQGFIPLGGNTVFMRRELLQTTGGWDTSCLAEDCDLGVRLSTLKRKVSVAFDPELTTLEEAPTTPTVWVKQRTRWQLGFMQVYAKGEWKALPTFKERTLARWTLMQPFMMAMAGIMIPLAVVMVFFLNPPMWITMIAFMPLFPTALIITMENVALHEYGKDFGTKVRFWDYIRLTISTPVYQMMAGFASLRAFSKYTKKDFTWYKTPHEGKAIDLLQTTHPHHITAETGAA